MLLLSKLLSIIIISTIIINLTTTITTIYHYNHPYYSRIISAPLVLAAEAAVPILALVDTLLFIVMLLHVDTLIQALYVT